MGAAQGGDGLIAVEHLCCPACRARILTAPDGTSLYCRECGRAYPYNGDFADFVESAALDEFAAWQRDIYNGKVASQHVPGYLQPEAVMRHNAMCLEVAERYGLLSPSWLGLSFREATDRLKPRRGETVLDVGCSTGIILNAMKAIYGIRGVGIDFSREAIAAGAAWNPMGNEYHVADALCLPFAEASFDIAVSYGVIEHVSSPAGMVSEMVRVLKPGGRMLIYTTCRRDMFTWHWWQRLTSGGKYNLGRDNLAGHDRDKFLLPQELSAIMEKAGLRRVETMVVHTLYTLIFDECYPGFLIRLLPHRGLFRAARKIFEIADALPSGLGFGNELMAVAWKEEA